MLHEIMALASQNGMTQFNVLNTVAQNIANLNTTGYKAQRFEQYLEVGGRVEGLNRTDTSIGQPLITRRELDVAIESEGYLPVTQPDGTVAYTRDGSMSKGPDGLLYTQRGDLVGSGIRLPQSYNQLFIQPNGQIEVETKAGEPHQVVGQLNLLTFANPEALKSIGGNKLVPTEQSGQPVLVGKVQFSQGKLERANVNVSNQVEQILRLNAGLISNFRVIKFTDDIFRQAVTLRQ